MAKPTSYDSATDPWVRIVFNHAVQETDAEGNPVTKYHPARIDMFCDAITTEGKKVRVGNSEPVGDNRDTKYTHQELYAKMSQAGMPAFFLNQLKDLRLLATADDISQ